MGRHSSQSARRAWRGRGNGLSVRVVHLPLTPLNYLCWMQDTRDAAYGNRSISSGPPPPRPCHDGDTNKGARRRCCPCAMLDLIFISDLRVPGKLARGENSVGGLAASVSDPRTERCSAGVASCESRRARARFSSRRPRSHPLQIMEPRAADVACARTPVRWVVSMHQNDQFDRQPR